MPKYVSASQISKFDDTRENGCQRRWGFRYISKLPDPAGAGAQLGGEVHDHLERYLRSKAVFPVATKSGKLAFQLLDYCREVQHRPGLEIEREFHHHEGGVHFMGKVDVRCLHPTGMSWVRDWKTSSNPAEYALRPSTMLDDTQAVLYARQELARPDVESREKVMLDWVYVKTRTPKIDPIVCRGHYTREAVEAAWPRVLKLGQRVTDARQSVKDPNSLPAQREACFAYNKPCPYMDVCDGAKDEKRIIRDLFKKPEPEEEGKKDSTMPTAKELLEKARQRQRRAAPTKPKAMSAKATEEEPTPEPKKPYMDPEKTREIYDKQEAEAAKEEDKEQSSARAEQVNAPESGDADVETQREVSKFVEVVISHNPGRGKAKEAREKYQMAMAEAVAEGKTPAEADEIAAKKAGLDEDRRRKVATKKKASAAVVAAGGPVDPSDAWLRIFAAVSRDTAMSSNDMVNETEIAFSAWQEKFGSSK